jgi:hypothetical protein
MAVACSQRKSISARILLWLFRTAQQRTIRDVPVAYSGSEDDADEVFARITTAFDLLGKYSKRTLTNLRYAADGIFVFSTAGALGEWHRETRLILLEETYLRDSNTSPQSIASTLVHEGTHARLDKLGFAYTPDVRDRIEKACFRRELAFARLLPDPGSLISDTEEQLMRPPDYLTDEAFRARTLGKLIELGVPRWLMYAIGRLSRRPQVEQQNAADARKRCG